jgi:hypothetical protein
LEEVIPFFLPDLVQIGLKHVGVHATGRESR